MHPSALSPRCRCTDTPLASIQLYVEQRSECVNTMPAPSAAKPSTHHGKPATAHIEVNSEPVNDSHTVFVFPVAGDAPHSVPAVALDVKQDGGFAVSRGKVMVSPVITAGAPAVEEIERRQSVDSDHASDSEPTLCTPQSSPGRQRLVLPASRMSAGMKDLKVQFTPERPISVTGSQGSSDKVSLFAAHA